MRTRQTITMVSVVVLWVGVVSCLAGQNVPALKDVFKDDFLIGGALNRNVVTGRDPNAAAIAEKHFSTATAENDLKWQLIHPQPNQYNWEPADSYVAFCEKNKMVAIGHRLVWHAQTPRWVFQDDSGERPDAGRPPGPHEGPHHDRRRPLQRPHQGLGCGQ